MGRRKGQPRPNPPGWRQIENLNLPPDVLVAAKAECRRVCADRMARDGGTWTPCVDKGHLCILCEKRGREAAIRPRP